MIEAMEEIRDALQPHAAFVTECPTTIDVHVADVVCYLRMDDDGVVSVGSGEWPGGASVTIRVLNGGIWYGMLSTPALLDALITDGSVTMDDTADPAFWWPRWRTVLDLHAAYVLELP
jgi:hypothetical protein